MPNDERFPSRKRPRLKGYDYTTPNYYFITICTWQKKCLFGKPGRLNVYGKLAEEGILQIERHFSNARVDKYVVMPNHLHLIVELHTKGSALSDIVGQYKAFVTRKIHGIEPSVRVWQASYHDHVIRNQRAYEAIWLYIESNAQNWEKDCFFAK